MRKIIFVALGFIFILGMLSLLSLLLPSKISVTKSVGINAPSSEVYTYVNDFKKWPEWFLPMEDSSVHITYGEGNASVTLKDDKGIDLVLEKLPSTTDTIYVALKSKSSSDVVYQFILIPQNAENTQIIFNINTYFKWYPWEKIRGLFLDKMTGPMYQKSLYQLEKKVEGR
jgi:hypothetical protein